MNKAKERGLTNVKPIAGDLVRVDLPRCYFDRAVSNSVIHHIPTADGRLSAVRRIGESLKTGGLAVVMVFRWGGAITYQKEYWTKTESGNLFRMGFTAPEFADLLVSAGFREVKVGGLFNFRPRGLSWLPFLLRPYAWMDGAFGRLAVSANIGKHLLAMGVK